MGDLETNKATSRRLFTELVNERRYDRIADIFDESIEITPRGLKGLQGVEQWLRHFHSGFSDCFDVILGQWGERDQVVTHIEYGGTHDGVWMGRSATGQKLVWQGIAIHKFHKGKIIHKHAVIDQAGAFRQLGWLVV